MVTVDDGILGPPLQVQEPGTAVAIVPHLPNGSMTEANWRELERVVKGLVDADYAVYNQRQDVIVHEWAINDHPDANEQMELYMGARVAALWELGHWRKDVPIWIEVW